MWRLRFEGATTLIGIMKKKQSKNWIKTHWLIVLIAAQPVLDAIAFWTQDEVATIAGYIRLGILVLIPLYLLFTTKKRGPFLLSLGVMALYSLLHIANSCRVGYINPYFDVAYLVKVLQMPVLAICFLRMIRDEQTKHQAFQGAWLAACLMGLCILLAFFTGTGNVTYGEGLGYSGWVIDDNRCANSILLVTLSVFAAYFAMETKKRLLTVLIPVLITTAFLTNGTKACYFSAFGIFGAFAVFLLLEKPVLQKKVKRLAVAVFAVLMVFSAVIYPYTPRCKVSASIARAAKQGEIEATLALKGYDVSKMTPEERYNNPEVREVFAYYYYRYMIAVIPDMFDRFGMDRVLLHYKMTTNAAKLIDTRVMKIAYSDMIWEDSDFLTKLVGFEVSQVGFDGTRDMENDWPALFYYYGYLGFVLYTGFLLYFLWCVLRRLREDFKGSFTEENFTLLLCLLLQLGLAQFSGAILRRPNVSIYLALILALIYYQTTPEDKREAALP